MLAVLGHEIRTLAAGRAFWTMALVMTVLTGYGFVEAVKLFGEASRTALEFPELARGMSPLDGILVPTMGAFYLGTTLLFPFVAIRALGRDRESGAIKLVLQWPLSPPALVGSKLLAVACAWALTLLAPVSAIGIWSLSGGHVAGPETFNLLFGHALYALAVAGIAFFAAAIAESAATAAIITLAFTLGFWVLDFAAGTGPEWLRVLGEISPTLALKQFEHGLFSLPHVLGLAALGIGLVALAAILLPTGRAPREKLMLASIAGSLLVAALVAAPACDLYADFAEDRRNSFNPADDAALARMEHELIVTLHLAPEDSRAQELNANVLGKLRRAVPHIKVRWAPVTGAGPFGAARQDNYGIVTYEYAGRSATSRSNSAREILPLIHGLAGARVTASDAPNYPGYPLVTDTRLAAAWFYGVLPTVLLIAAWQSRRRTRRLPDHLRGLRS